MALPRRRTPERDDDPEQPPRDVRDHPLPRVQTSLPEARPGTFLLAHLVVGEIEGGVGGIEPELGNARRDERDKGHRIQREPGGIIDDDPLDLVIQGAARGLVERRIRLRRQMGTH